MTTFGGFIHEWSVDPLSHPRGRAMVNEKIYWVRTRLHTSGDNTWLFQTLSSSVPAIGRRSCPTCRLVHEETEHVLLMNRRPCRHLFFSSCLQRPSSRRSSFWRRRGMQYSTRRGHPIAWIWLVSNNLSILWSNTWQHFRGAVWLDRRWF